MRFHLHKWDNEPPKRYKIQGTVKGSEMLSEHRVCRRCGLRQRLTGTMNQEGEFYNLHYVDDGNTRRNV